MDVSFGDFTLDLTEAGGFADNASLDVKASFGEAVILLPKTVRTEFSSTGSFAGKTVKGEPDEDAPYKLILNSTVSFGNITVKYED